MLSLRRGQQKLFIPTIYSRKWASVFVYLIYLEKYEVSMTRKITFTATFNPEPCPPFPYAAFFMEILHSLILLTAREISSLVFRLLIFRVLDVITAIAWHPNSRYLATAGGADRHIRVWHNAAGVKVLIDDLEGRLYRAKSDTVRVRKFTPHHLTSPHTRTSHQTSSHDLISSHQTNQSINNFI